MNYLDRQCLNRRRPDQATIITEMNALQLRGNREQRCIREGDILMRYGGEKFLVILPSASKENSRDVAERMRRKVEETSVADGDQVLRVTISIGITSYPEQDVAGEQDLVKRADEALYADQ